MMSDPRTVSKFRDASKDPIEWERRRIGGAKIRIVRHPDGWAAVADCDGFLFVTAKTKVQCVKQVRDIGMKVGSLVPGL